MQRTFFKILLKHIVVILILFAIVFIFYFFKIPCLFRFVTGIPCPSCGMTRAFLSFLSFDFPSSFSYHPLLLPSLFTMFIAIHYNVKFFNFNKKACNIYFTIFIIIFMAVYFYRLLHGIIL